METVYEKHKPAREYLMEYYTWVDLLDIERREFNDILAYLKLANSFQDDLSFERIINLPKRGVGDQSVKLIIDYAREKNISFFESLESLSFENNREVHFKMTRRTGYGDRYKLFVIEKDSLKENFSLEDYGINLINKAGLCLIFFVFSGRPGLINSKRKSWNLLFPIWGGCG